MRTFLFVCDVLPPAAGLVALAGAPRRAGAKRRAHNTAAGACLRTQRSPRADVPEGNLAPPKLKRSSYLPRKQREA